LTSALKYVVDHGFALAKYRANERAAAQAVAAGVVVWAGGWMAHMTLPTR
jgi:hypothetical protein